MEINTDGVDVVSMAQQVKMNMEKHVTLDSQMCLRCACTAWLVEIAK